ncbi:unnamed protein product [Larinioides sclopetarius]|uniref:ATP-dependent helicase ATRX n=1 Tax=Larinioides sclopetarius TaxID=280406 RepID=A0AAV1Z7W8_9ARAC
MSDSASPVIKDNPSDQEDLLIEIPHLAGNELVKKSQLTRMDIRGLVVRCTSCLHQINHHDLDKFKKHIRLGVIICSDCYDFYGTSEFSQDESGNYNYCAWCGNGGKLFLCDFCPNTFCSTCVRRNFGRAAVSEMTKEGWKCYCCDPSKLKHKVAFCDLILEYSKNVQRKRDKKTSSAEPNKNGIKNLPESHNLLLSAFDSVDDSCKSFHRRLEKLKNIGLSQSKSLKHIIAKFGEIVNSHRSELNHEIKSLSRQYISYIENQKKIEKSSESKTDDITEKTENKTGLDKIESKPDSEKIKSKPDSDNDADEIGDSLKADKSGDVEMEYLSDHKDESKANDEEAKINEDNYKAKLSLLSQAESSLSEIDDILAEAPLMDDSEEEHSKNSKIATEEKPSASTSDVRMSSDVNDANNEKEALLNGSDSDIAELFCSESDKTKKVSVNRKLDFDSSSPSSVPEDSESSIYLSSGGELERKPKNKENKSMKKTKTRKIVTKDDPKLKLRTSVLLKSCAHLLPDGETTIPLPASCILEDLDKEMKSLIKEPVKRDRRKHSDTQRKNKPKAIKKPKVSKNKDSGSSSSICLSSSEDEEVTKKKLFKANGDDPNALAKKKILSMASDESSFTDSSKEEEEEPKKKKKSGKSKTQSGSSDDFQPKKKKKFDKLLHKRILSDEDSDFEEGKKSGERKKTMKRKRLASDDSKSENKKLNSDETTSSDSDEDKQRKKKKRKRIKKAADTSSSDEDKKKDEEGASQNTPGKGRKNIKKILSKKDLAMETKEAQNLERERRKRVQERQKMVHELTLAKDNYSRVDVLTYWQRDGGILIISYDLFRRLASAKIKGLKSKGKATIYSSLIDPGPDIVICDEGHVLKNVNSAISKACSTINTERRIVLTGTPLQNNLLEYHCMLSFVKPHLLGTPKEFRNRFVNPIMNGQYDDSTEYDVKRMKKRIHILHKILEGCVQRCDYAALTKFLPPKHEFVISVKLSEIQIKMYRWYLDNMSRAKTQVKIQGGTLFSDYNILRNLCTHPYIVRTSHERAEKRRLLKFDDEEEEEFINDESEETAGNSSTSDVDEVVRKYKTRSRQNNSDDDIEEEPLEAVKEKAWFDDFISDEDKYKLELSGKMVLLVDILKECEAIGDKVIVFSQSLLTFDLIEDLLSYLDEQSVTEEEESRDIRNTWRKNVDYFRMDGSTSAEFRKQYIDYFNDPANDRARLFLVSTKAGGLGTNLVGANRVIMLDASWNPSHDVQAIFRVYRFGQKKPVYIYRFLAQGTMEEKIYDRQVTKLSLSIRVVDEQQIDRHFNAAELAELYNFEPESLPNRPTPMVPRDNLLAEMLIKHKDWIVTYHEHDSLLQNETEEDLTEEERKAAWAEFENEREGRFVVEEQPLDETIKGFCREPDFNDAIYEGSVIPTAKSMIEAIISAFRKQYPSYSAAALRKKLQVAIFNLRALFQEKHVKTLRMKQEYVAKGSVPVAVNKYLEELNHIVSELSMHYENVTGLVKKDLEAAYKAQMAQKMANQFQQNAQFGNRPFNLNMPNQPPFNVNIAQMNQAAFAAGFPQFANVRMNIGGAAPNFKPGDTRWNPAQTQKFNEFCKQLAAQKAATVITPVSEPVITESETNEPTPSALSNNMHSTVEITEIE